MELSRLIALFIGTYTSPGGSEGIYSALLNIETGEITEKRLFTKLQNPSYLLRRGETLYAVSEKANGEIWGFDMKGEEINHQTTGGDYPCHLDHDGEGIVVANYNKGVFARYFLSAKGELQTPEFFTNRGSGPNKSRQDASHAHYIGETEKNLFACDLGTDEVLVFKKGSLKDPVRFKTAPGAGPRHAAFDANRNVLFVNNELNCTVSALRFDEEKGSLTELNTLSTLPEGASLKGNSTAEIRVLGGRFVYVSNRGHHSIASYSIQKDGKLKLIEIIPAGVKTPRGMNIDPSGTWLLVAGQDDNVIKSFRINAKTGKLKPSGFSLAVGKPVDIAF